MQRHNIMCGANCSSFGWLADRSEADRARLRQLNEELAGVEGLFNRNDNDDQRAIFVKPEELEGLPKDYIESHKPGAGGLVRITTDRTDIGPVMSYAERETLRHRRLFEYESLGYQKFAPDSSHSFGLFPGLVLIRQRRTNNQGDPDIASLLLRHPAILLHMRSPCKMRFT
jgi:hypothetical protein